MIGIIFAKLRLLLRKPATFLLMTIISMVFAYSVGLGGKGKAEVPVYSSLTSVEELLTKLNGSENFAYVLGTKKDAENDVRNGGATAAVELLKDGYTIVRSNNEANIPLINNELQMVYTNKLQDESVLAQTDELPIFNVKQSNFANDQEKVYDAQLQGLFGFSLFFVIYTIGNSVYHIMEEKRNRIWDRLILSSVNKWEMYTGNLLYSFLTGYAQIVLIFCTFRFIADVDFYGGFGKTLIVLIPYVLSIVALCILLASLAGTPGKYNAYLSMTAVPLAMVGGAYWPLEIVTSKIMLFLAKITPVNYGMQLLNGATVNGYSYGDLLEPMSILLLMAVIMMGIGLNVIEKRDT